MLGKKEENGIIRSTFLGVEDHGIMTFNIDIEFEGAGQGFGGYALDGADPKDKNSRVGSPAAATSIRNILETLEVKCWEDLPGTTLRVFRDNEGYIREIGHIFKDKKFNIKKHFKKYHP